jgi:hypothetical protein
MSLEESGMDLVPDRISPEQQHLPRKTVLFVTNAQIPRIIKNMGLVGVCALFSFLAPSLDGTPHGQTAKLKGHQL